MKLTRQQVAMVAVLLTGTLLAVLNQTLLTPALPSIMEHLNVSATTAQWLTSGYSLVEAVIIPLNAYLLGRFPSKNLYVGGIGLFTVGSVLCASAPNFAFLMAGRICQAMATGVLMPTVFTQILLIFPRERRGSAMGLIGLILSFAPAVGPSISGVLVDNIGWRALFVVVVCIAAAIVVLSAAVLRNFDGFERSPLDAPSVALMALGMLGLLYGLSTFSSSPSLTVPVVCIVIGLCLVGLFARRQLRLETPILDISVLKHRCFATAVLLVGLIEAVLIGSGVILPIFIQNALGQSATASGLLMLPGAACGAVCGLLAGRLFDRFGIRGVTLGGAALLMLGVGGYFTFHANVSLFTVGLFYTFACVGLQSLVTPVNAWGINDLPNTSVPHGNAIVSTVEQVGASFGTAFVVSLTAFAPTDAASLGEAAEILGLEAGTTFAGCHIAFAGLAALTVVIALAILLGTHKRKAATLDPGQTPSE